MDTSRILAELRSERERIDQAIAALEALMPNAASRPQAQAHKQSLTSAAPAKRGGKRTMSAAARRKISEAAKRRWAEARKKAGKAA